MIEAQKIACTNNAAFVMSFSVQTQSGKTPPTGKYPINQTKVIDLATSGLKPGDECWPEVHAVLGKTEASDDHIIFAMNGQTATYEVKGVTLRYSIKLIGQPAPAKLPDFPADIPVNQYDYTNWAGDLSKANVWT